VETAIRRAGLPDEAVEVLRRAPQQPREMLVSSGWVRHTLESAVWGLLTSDSFEEAVVKVANLGNDADTAASVTGALAGAANGLSGIPARWRESLRGRWPPASPQEWREEQFIQLADRLMG
jgi:ADP-ribosyl-[dinitrogen reductase] hydrolase